MAITRTPIIDDDGTGTTGTVIDNAWKQELYGQIDGVVAASSQAWQARPYAAGNFLAKPSMTWTVTAGAATIDWYAVVGNVLLWNLAVEGSTTGGTPSTELWVYVPNQVTAKRKVWGLARLYQVAGGWVDAEAIVNAGDAVLRISRKDGAALTVDSSTYVHFQIMVPI